jgi:Uma2 family endonuclease
MAVVASPTTPLLTADDLLAMPPDDLEHWELWKGHLVKMSPAGGAHPWIGRRLMLALDTAATTGGIGEVWAFEAGYLLQRNPDTVMAPDLALVPAAYVERMSVTSEGFHHVVPPLVVEVKSPSDRETEITRKLSLYLEAGVPEVWWVRPKPQTITRYWPDRDPAVLGVEDTLDAVEALPGFTLALADLFAPAAASR